MEKKISLRLKVSLLANQKIENLKTQKRVDGEKLTKEQVIEYMLINFKENGKRNKTS